MVTISNRDMKGYRQQNKVQGKENQHSSLNLRWRLLHANWSFMLSFSVVERHHVSFVTKGFWHVIGSSEFWVWHSGFWNVIGSSEILGVTFRFITAPLEIKVPFTLVIWKRADREQPRPVRLISYFYHHGKCCSGRGCLLFCFSLMNLLFCLFLISNCSPIHPNFIP